MYVFGFHPVREALRARPAEVRRVLVARDRGRRRDEIEALCRRAGVAMEAVAAARLDELTETSHNGLAAELAGVAAARLDELTETSHNGLAAELAGVAEPRRGGDPDLVVLLEDVQDPRNLGALLRVCEGAGVGRVLIRDRGSAPLSATARRTAAGAAEWLAIERVTNSANEIERLRKAGFWVYGADPAGDPVWDVDLAGRLCLCLGGEEKGLRRRTRGLCDRLVALPMLGRVGSLNVATAAAALLFEAQRQRRAAGA